MYRKIHISLNTCPSARAWCVRCCGHPKCRKEETDARDDDETMNDTDTDDGAAAVSYGIVVVAAES